MGSRLQGEYPTFQRTRIRNFNQMAHYQMPKLRVRPGEAELVCRFHGFYNPILYTNVIATFTETYSLVKLSRKI